MTNRPSNIPPEPHSLTPRKTSRRAALGRILGLGPSAIGLRKYINSNSNEGGIRVIGKVSKVPWRSVVTAAATAAVLSALMGVPQAVAASGASILQDERHRILTFAGKCLTVRSIADNAPIDQRVCGSLNDQKFTFHPVGDGRYEIKTFTDKCLTVRDGSTANSALIEQSGCADRTEQKFRIYPLPDEYRVEIRTFADKCVTVYGGAVDDNAPIVQHDCIDHYAQKFELAPAT